MDTKIAARRDGSRMAFGPRELPAQRQSGPLDEHWSVAVHKKGLTRVYLAKRHGEPWLYVWTTFHRESRQLPGDVQVLPVLRTPFLRRRPLREILDPAVARIEGFEELRFSHVPGHEAARMMAEVLPEDENAKGAGREKDIRPPEAPDGRREEAWRT